jgi:POT family proton-dependent oligopeptide transporter
VRCGDVTSYRTAPVASPSLPGGIPYIIANEAAERFSFYRMRAILVIFMTRYLPDTEAPAAKQGGDLHG